MTERIRMGQVSEELVTRELTRRGYTLLARNYRTRRGELDIVVRRASEVVVVEVRSRRNDTGSEALDSVQAPKRHKVRRTAERFLAGRPVDYREVRFFMATVNWVGGKPSIEIIEDAF